MNTPKRTIAAIELMFIAPAALFMAALLVRSLQPVQYEPARTAQSIVDWYAARPRVGLWVFLMALPLLALVIGWVTLASSWHADPELRQAVRQTLATLRSHPSMLLIALATLVAAAVLAIVAVHALAG